MADLNNCIYCKKNYSDHEEHVFPNGLGGQKLYMDCVCQECNNYFSKLEGELYKKSPIALMRSTEGIEGYTRRNAAPAPFKAPVLLLQDEVFGIVYEVGQYHRMQTFIRTQLIFFESQYYLEGNTLEDSGLLFKALQKWLKNEALLTASTGDQLIVWKYTLTNGAYSMTIVSPVGKMNSAIKYMPLPSDHQLFTSLTPRLYLDDEKKLRVRAQTKEEAAVFLKRFLDHTLTAPAFNSFRGSDISHATVNVGFSFNGRMFDQALVKIALNCLLFYFPTVRESQALAPIVSYIMTGEPGIHAAWDQKNAVIDSKENHHNIFFAQTEDHTHIRISLFNGQFAYGFWINDLRLFPSKNYARLLIDYKNKVNTFQDYRTFLMSFPRGEQAPKI